VQPIRSVLENSRVWLEDKVGKLRADLGGIRMIICGKRHMILAKMWKVGAT
jgi:hypothetical protein